MKINTILVADYASVDPSNGKLDILGVFRQVSAENFPVTLRRICLVVIVQEDPDETTDFHLVEAFMEDAEGEIITTIEATYEFPERKATLPEPYGLICEFSEPIFDEPGEYRFGVQMNDGEITDSVIVEVVQREN